VRHSYNPLHPSGGPIKQPGFIEPDAQLQGFFQTGARLFGADPIFLGSPGQIQIFFQMTGELFKKNLNRRIFPEETATC
jgi:hypothetical protein